MCVAVGPGVVVVLLSCVWLFVTPWTIAHESPLSLGFPRQEYWSGLPLVSPEDLPDPVMEPKSPVLAGEFFTTEPLGKSPKVRKNYPKTFWSISHICWTPTQRFWPFIFRIPFLASIYVLLFILKKIFGHTTPHVDMVHLIFVRGAWKGEGRGAGIKVEMHWGPRDESDMLMLIRHMLISGLDCTVTRRKGYPGIKVIIIITSCIYWAFTKCSTSLISFINL